jgi:phenylalanyl-tRNA synthetase beta chain
MVDRLERSGLRSRGPIVDVTNYVLLELGQPMHAFDLNRLSGGIHVRRARAGETFSLLDGQQIEPDPDMLLICDHDGPVALAGIMGGQDAAVGDETRDILLESAWFNPSSIIGRARRLGLSTDSSFRFERGVDPELQVSAVERATALIQSIAGGIAGPVVERCAADSMPARPVIALRPERVNYLLGTSLEPQAIIDILTRLGMRVDGEGASIRVTPPAARRDLSLEVDLIEEVARMVGYDALPSSLPGGRLVAVIDSERCASMSQLRSQLHARGFQEIMTWSFVSHEDLERLSLDQSAQPLANPLSQEMGSLRTTLLPGLLRTAATNLRRQQSRLKLFETGHVFIAGDGWSEQERLGVLIAGRALPESWNADKRAFDFFDLKGEIEQLIRGLGHDRSKLAMRADPRPWLHPGQSAIVELDGEALGHAGQLHPATAAELDLDVPVFVAELDLDALRRRLLPEYASVSKTPSVRRDLALLVPDSVPAAQIERAAAEAAGEWLHECVIFDQYQGENIESGYKSLAIGLILRHVSRTLTDDEVDSVILGVVKSLKHACNVRLRG